MEPSASRQPNLITDILVVYYMSERSKGQWHCNGMAGKSLAGERLPT